VWGSGVGAEEAVYLTQTEKPSWPNYHATRFNRPGSGDIIEHEGNYFRMRLEVSRPTTPEWVKRGLSIRFKQRL